MWQDYIWCRDFTVHGCRWCRRPLDGRKTACCSSECTTLFEVNHFWGPAAQEAWRHGKGRQVADPGVGVMLVPEYVTVRVLTVRGWQTIHAARLHQTVEWPEAVWWAHLTATFHQAEGRTVAALERQEREA